MIHIKDLSYTVGNQVILNQINISINQGEKIALIGPSGAGKSSLLNILNQKVTTFQGVLEINKISIKHLTDQRKYAEYVGSISQHLDMIENLSVRSNILIGQFRHWSLWQSFKELYFKKKSIKPLLASLGLEGFEEKKVHLLSGGEKQRVAIARVLTQAPHIILADEPIASLDPVLSNTILKLFVEKSAAKTLLVSLHQESFATKYFDRVIALKDGKIFFDLNSNEVTAQILDTLYERSL